MKLIKKMNLKHGLLFASFFFMSFATFGGGASSGGGASFVCRDGSGKVISAELLDIFEGKYADNLSISDDAKSDVGSQIDAASLKLLKSDPEQYYRFEYTLQNVRESWIVLPGVATPAASNDANP